MELATTIPLFTNLLVPQVGQFTILSHIHGRAHIARVMVLGFALLKLLKRPDLEIPLWASVYVHDLGRKNDDRCQRHGDWAVEKMLMSPEILDRLYRGGLAEAQIEAVSTAVEYHCKPLSLRRESPHWYLSMLLKEIDALDRIRLCEFDERYLRLPESKRLIPVARELYRHTMWLEQYDANLMDEVWDVATSILKPI
ncbi:MAG: hypothetical protein OEM52_08165 [bacterium]|nr:hypothetical protein [bacterium]